MKQQLSSVGIKPICIGNRLSKKYNVYVSISGPYQPLTDKNTKTQDWEMFPPGLFKPGFISHLKLRISQPFPQVAYNTDFRAEFPNTHKKHFENASACYTLLINSPDNHEALIQSYLHQSSN